MPSKIYLESGQTGPALVETLLNRPNNQWPLDHGLRKVSFQHSTSPKNTTKKRRRTQQPNYYKKHERQLGELPPVAEKWNFLSQEEYDKLFLTVTDVS